MKLYLFTRKDCVNHDEYNGFVIAAESLESGKEIVNKVSVDFQLSEVVGDWEGTLISKVTEPGVKAGIVLGSFNAG
jgi:hypothetical protein